MHVVEQEECNEDIPFKEHTQKCIKWKHLHTHTLHYTTLHYTTHTHTHTLCTKHKINTVYYVDLEHVNAYLWTFDAARQINNECRLPDTTNRSIHITHTITSLCKFIDCSASIWAFVYHVHPVTCFYGISTTSASSGVQTEAERSELPGEHCHWCDL